MKRKRQRECVRENGRERGRGRRGGGRGEVILTERREGMPEQIAGDNEGKGAGCRVKQA